MSPTKPIKYSTIGILSLAHMLNDTAKAGRLAAR